MPYWSIAVSILCSTAACKLSCSKKVCIWLTIIAIVVLSITLGLVFGLKSKDDDKPQYLGAVVSNGEGCADVGRDMLQDGGSAVDAAIAVLLCEGIILPHSMGAGGGFMATIYTKSTGKIETLIARERAPAKAHRDMFVGQNSITGALAGAVPGELIGYWELHQKYGRLPWRVLFQPTIKLCKEGHTVTKFLAAALKSKEENIRNESSMAEIFVKPDGTLYQEGDTMKRLQLGKTFEVIAEKGVGEMYDGGEIGKMFAEDIQALGGIITAQDLKDYRPRFDDQNHVVAKLGGDYTLYTTPLPSSGALIVFILNILNGLHTNNSNTYWQRVVESFKHAFGQRTKLGDAAEDPVMADSIRETYNKLLSQDFANEIRKLISDESTRQDYEYYGANFTMPEDHGTANMAVLAANGDAITVTSTINTFFGSKVASRRTGIILNDIMDDFSTPGLINSFGVPASPSNYIYPHKMPMSAMSPAIILDKEGNVRMLVGAAGGTRITTSIATAIIKYLILNESIEESVNGGRLHHQLAPMRVDAEYEVPENLREHLAKIGHKVNTYAEGSGFAALTAIGVRDGVPVPFFDRRRVGSVAIVYPKNKMQRF